MKWCNVSNSNLSKLICISTFISTLSIVFSNFIKRYTLEIPYNSNTLARVQLYMILLVLYLSQCYILTMFLFFNLLLCSFYILVSVNWFLYVFYGFGAKLLVKKIFPNFGSCIVFIHINQNSYYSGWLFKFFPFNCDWIQDILNFSFCWISTRVGNWKRKNNGTHL